MDVTTQAPESFVDEEADFAPDPNAPKRHYLIYCDESGMHGSTYYAFGALWMPWERRGDFQALVRNLRKKYNYTKEIKWGNVKDRPALYAELIEEFFARRWLMFHSIVVNRNLVDRKFHEGRFDVAMQKHQTMFLKAKIAQFATPEKRYRVRLDYRQTRFKRADEVTGIIANHQIAKELKLRPIDSVLFADSRATVGIQVADVLLGCVFSAWEKGDTHEVKAKLRQQIAMHLGWKDLHADTHPKVWKFNVWHFWSSASCEPRPIVTRTVAPGLVYRRGQLLI